MSELEIIYQKTGTTNEVELSTYIDSQLAKLDTAENQLKEVQEQLSIAKTELDTAKKEQKKARTQATKGDSKISSLESKNSVLNQELKSIKEEKRNLVAELNNQAKEIVELKDKVGQGKKNLPTLDQLRTKAKIVMDQQDLDKVFISLTGQVFINESVISNAFGSKYKIATLVDEEKVHLSKPTR